MGVHKGAQRLQRTELAERLDGLHLEHGRRQLGRCQMTVVREQAAADVLELRLLLGHRLAKGVLLVLREPYDQRTL